jgi:hypothetical protein
MGLCRVREARGGGVEVRQMRRGPLLQVRRRKEEEGKMRGKRTALVCV